MKEGLNLKNESRFRFWEQLTPSERTEHMNTSQIGVTSEIGRLRKVFVHTPGKEVELMTPKMASELLYNDIVYYKDIIDGHNQLKSVLGLVSEVLEVSQCLEDVLSIPNARNALLEQILFHQNAMELKPELLELSASKLAHILITGLPSKKNSLESWLSHRTYALVPMPNMYFMRDTSMVVGKRVITSRMASRVRFNEAMIMRTIYEYHPRLAGNGLLLDAYSKYNDPKFTIEGGDVLVLNENILLIGVSERTTSRAVDALVQSLLQARQEEQNNEPFHVLCVLLPQERSTIHLDMIFTLAGPEQAVVYAPYVLGRERARVIHIRIKGNGEKKFKEEDNIILALKNIGIKIDPILCGGDNPLNQQREQWNSGSNLFAFAPGKVISYIHEHTLKSCDAAGFKIVSAKDVIKHPLLIQNDSPMVVTIEGSELSRGGGGPRCMTCPILRD